MPDKKLKVVHYLNQFFGQIGGEEVAEVGFSLEKGPIGPGRALQTALADQGEVVATLICGDNYIAREPDKYAKEGFEMIKEFEPDLFIAGPAFAAGRYGPACGAMCKIVNEKIGIPAVTAMFEENPGVDLYRQDAYIIKTGDNAKEMVPVIQKMLRLAYALLEDVPNEELINKEHIPSPYKYDYYTRNIIRNIFTEKLTAERSLDLLMKKIKGEPFKGDVGLPTFEKVDPPPPIKDIANAKIAFATDGGLTPVGNPDKFVGRSCPVWGEYELNDLFTSLDKAEFEIMHFGYNNFEVENNYNRMLPIDHAREFVKNGVIGELNPTFFSTCGNCGVAKRASGIGDEMAVKLKEEGVDGVILTSA